MGGYNAGGYYIVIQGKNGTLKNIICKNLNTGSAILTGVDANIDIINCEFSGNMTMEGPTYLVRSNVRVLNTKIISNVAQGEGGGITLRNGHLCAGGSTIIQGNGSSNGTNPFFPVEVDMGSGSGTSFAYESTVTIGPGGILDPMGYKKITIVSSCPAPF
jgi:hypothetical protein